MFEFEVNQAHDIPTARIKVIGVGGAGGNTVNSMIEAQSDIGIEFIAANTDAQALSLSKAPHRIQLGVKSTKGLGAGANPELGKRAAEEDLSKIMDILEDADIVFLTGGMGGGTGSGALPVIARALKEKNILSIAIVTKPFHFEGKKRATIAQESIDALRKEVDTLLIVPNQKLLETVDHNVSMIDAFGMINSLLHQSVKGIADIITKPGHINVDFADVRTIMKDMGLAIMGTGKATGKDRALDAAYQAISSPLLENMTIKGARGILINISGGLNLGLHEIGVAASVIAEQAEENASIIVGSVIDKSLNDEIIVTVIATGFIQQQTKTAHEAPTFKPAVEQNVVMPEPEIVVVAKPVHRIEQTPIQSVLEHTEKPIVAQEKKEEVIHQNIDINDLDVPTFLRQQKEVSGHE
jgi:cell division protein FtsZ